MITSLQPGLWPETLQLYNAGQLTAVVETKPCPAMCCEADGLRLDPSRLHFKEGERLCRLQWGRISAEYSCCSEGMKESFKTNRVG